MNRYPSGVSARLLALVAFLALCAAPRAAYAQIKVTKKADSGAGTLRDAINTAQAGQTITFDTQAADSDFKNPTGDITLSLQTQLPALTKNNVTIDGYLGNGKFVILDGTNVKTVENGGAITAGANGLVLAAGGCVIKNFKIFNFATNPNNPNVRGNGILVQGGAADPIAGNMIQGCFILGNKSDGVLIVNGKGNLIGGTTVRAGPSDDASSPGNLIARNTGNGIHIAPFDRTANASGTMIQGNLIGTDAAGLKQDANMASGIKIEGAKGGQGEMGLATGNLIGRVAINEKLVGTGNVISGNAVHGIWIETMSNVIAGNLIGTDFQGFTAIPNTKNGVLLNGPPINGQPGARQASGNIIGIDVTYGGADQFQMTNVISGNGNCGIEITGINATQNMVKGNIIGAGLNPKARDLGNLYGVFIADSASKNVIGGTPNDPNRERNRRKNNIKFNKKKGVDLHPTAGKENSIDPTAFFNNGMIGIDLGDDGPTPNDSEGHSGPNNFQDFPLLLSATAVGSQTLVTGYMPAPPDDSNFPMFLEFFDNSAPDQAGVWEGERYLATLEVDFSTPGPLGVPFTVLLPGADVITATATDSSGNTSEFSMPIAVTPDASDVSASVRVRRGGYRYSNTLGLYVQSVTLTNTGAAPVAGPVTLVLDGLSGGASLVNADGMTLAVPPLGSPTVNAVDATGVLNPGGSATITLYFSDPTNAGFTYTTRVLAGPGAR